MKETIVTEMTIEHNFSGGRIVAVLQGKAKALAEFKCYLRSPLDSDRGSLLEGLEDVISFLLENWDDVKPLWDKLLEYTKGEQP